MAVGEIRNLTLFWLLTVKFSPERRLFATLGFIADQFFLYSRLKSRVFWLTLTITDTAREMGISRTTLYRILSGKQPISAGLALALEQMGWSNAEFWMRRQANFDLAVARKKVA